MMKWLWIECPPALWARSCSVILPNGTLPITRSISPSGRAVSAKLSARMVASG